ncbi:hypothetical protein PG994_009602 [Apiospora phragmitis]|uniref:Uncharacterized protein n=1 Tax=Apiospora phragmitis TaxID=2905665 RepID=A0ABR1U6N1_9PEZI
MQLAALAFTTATVATTVLAAGASPITTTSTTSASTFSSLTHSSSHSSSTHFGTASPLPKPQGTGSPQQGGRPLVHVTVEAPASDDACGKGTNTTILVPIDGVYTNRTTLGKVAALYLTGVTAGGSSPGLRREDITCAPYLKENGTGTPAGNAFTFSLPSRLAPVVGTPNHVGSIFCMVPIAGGGLTGIPRGGKQPPNGEAPGGGAGVAGTGNNATAIIVPFNTPVPTPINPTAPPPPPAQSSQVPASGVEELGVPALMSAALFGVLGIMFTL